MFCNPQHTLSPVRVTSYSRSINLPPPISAGRPDHDQQHCSHHAPTVKPEAATAVVELLRMGVRTPRNMLSCT